MRQLSTWLSEKELENLRSEILRREGQLQPSKSKWELFRFKVGGYKGIAYSSGKVVYHEPLISLIEDSLIELPGTEVGSDEAGKGEKAGPIVVAAVALDEYGRRRLRAKGLLESKSIPKERLEEIANNIEELALSIEYKVVAPEELLSVWRRGILNQLLAKWHFEVISKILGRIKVSRVIVDSFDDRRLKEAFSTLMDDINVIIEPKADERYSSAAAASVIAKRIYLRNVGGDLKWK